MWCALCAAISNVSVNVCFVVTHMAVFVSLQIVKEHYGHFAKQEATLRVRFEHSKITLDIPEDGQVTKEGWRITPRTHPTVSEHTHEIKV